MSQNPPYPPYGQGPPAYPQPPPYFPSRTSAAAVTSLVMGLLGCVPLLTGALAILTGIIGITVTGNPAVKGRGMAIAGLILGILSILGWTAVSGVAWRWWVISGPQRVVARHFILDLSQGNTSAAAAESTDQLTAAQLDAATTKIKSWLPIQRVRVFASPNGMVNGIAICPNGQIHTFMLQEVQQNGVWNVDSFELRQ
jgi:hypothetical protein